MAGVEFTPDKEKILFFCRGRGNGHAIPDIEVVKELATVRPEAEVRFVSYGTGATTLAEHGHEVIDIQLPELNSMLDVIVIATKLIGALDPDLVMSHEEFGALPAAAVFDKPVIFLTDWFVSGDRIIMETLRHADKILFADLEGKFEEPPQAQGKTQYVGPIFREFEYSTADRGRARRELELPEDATVISVLPGGHATETKAPIADVVLEAFDLLEQPCKQLVWVPADADLELLREKTREREDVRIMERDWRIDRLIAASDAAITKANRKTVLELEFLGLPSVALSPELNPIDDARARACEGVKFRLLAEIRADVLAADLEQAIGRGRARTEKARGARAAALVARSLAEALEQMKGHHC